MIKLVFTIVGALLGIVGTWIKYRLDPRQRVYDGLDDIAKRKLKLERQRDEALLSNNTDALTVAGNALFKLRDEEAKLLQRLRTIAGRR